MMAESDLHVVRAKLEIQDVLLRYARGLDRFDEDMVAGVYHDGDGQDDYHGNPVGGREFAHTMIDFLAKGFLWTSHLITNMLIEVEGDVAFSESKYYAIQRFAREGKELDLNIAGRYIDRFERRGGVWKIAYRYRVSDWSRVDPVDESLSPFGGGARRNTLRGLRSMEDPVYTHTKLLRQRATSKRA